jgi:hypothetical protein
MSRLIYLLITTVCLCCHSPIDREALVKRHTVTLDKLSASELL